MDQKEKHFLTWDKDLFIASCIGTLMVVFGIFGVYGLIDYFFDGFISSQSELTRIALSNFYK